MPSQKPAKPAHVIAELICRRYFKTKGFADLPTKFWNDIRFARDYKLQMIKAYALMKTYSPEAIINALKTPQGSKIYSLTAAWLDAIIATEQAKLEKLARQLENVANAVPEKEIILENTTPRPTFQKKESLLDKLD
jgi:hypothetical protein